MQATADEAVRVEALRGYAVLDTEPDEIFDGLTRIAAQLLNVPVSLVSLVDTDRQWFKARHGFSAQETARDIAFCDHAIRGSGPMVVEDALKDPRFADNPLVLAEPKVRFYAGVPLRSPDGYGLGTLCVIDRKPRSLTPAQLDLLQLLAVQVQGALEMHRKAAHLSTHNAELSQRQESKELLASMSVHDLRSPLTAIMAIAASEASLGELGPSRRAFLDILAAARRMQRMLLDVLDICLSEAGQLTLRPAKTDLLALASEQTAGMTPIAELSDCKLVVDGPSGGLDVVVDPELMTRVIGNLIENALKYSPPGTTVEVEVRRVESYVELSVSDEAPTIPDADRLRILEPFVRNVSFAHGRGYGLGLAFCRLASESHRGNIRVEAREPKGNRFTVQLPA